MKILVTGANGFLGQWLIKRLIDEGDEISVLIRNPKDFNIFQQKGIQVFHGDVTNESSLTAAIKGQTQIYHLAGLVAYDRQQYQTMNFINATGTENIFRIASLHQVQRILTVSSVVSVGASFKPQILNEESIYNLSEYNFGYHESKRKAEAIVCKYVKENKVDGVIVNPSTIYGPGDASKSTRSTQLKVAQGKMFYYPTGGVSVAYVEDVVDGMIKAMQKGRSAQRYILAGENIYLKDLFNLIVIEAGVTKPWLPIPTGVMKAIATLDENLSKIGFKGPMTSERALVAIMFHWYSSEKAKQELGFTIRPAQQSIASSVRWMTEQGLLRK